MTTLGSYNHLQNFNCSLIKPLNSLVLRSLVSDSSQIQYKIQQPKGILALEYTPPPPQINMEHNNEGLEDDFPLQMGDFQVPCSFSSGVDSFTKAAIPFGPIPFG